MFDIIFSSVFWHVELLNNGVILFRFHREDMLATLLSQFDGGRGTGPASTVKCVPSYVAPDLASAIRRHISNQIRQRKGHFPCNYICEWATYSLPSGRQNTKSNNKIG